MALFHDKKCCNCIKLFPCILWDFIVLDLVLSWWKIEHVLDKVSRFHECLAKSLPAKEPCEKHMLETEESWQAISFASVSQERPTCEILAKLSVWRFLSITFLPFTYTIYTLITHKSKRGHAERKTLDKFSTTQHTHLLERELLILSEKSL